MPVVQLAGLLVIATAGAAHPRLLLGAYIPLIVLAAVLAAVRMDNLAPVRNDTGAVREALKDAHTWIMSFLYIGTFGSFIGYSFAFGLVLQTQFGRTPLQAASLTFIGPLLGSLIRPVGGALADRFGGARITLGTFVAMAAATGVVVFASGRSSLPVFLVGFVALFVLSGLGNGSTYKMIPGIFQAKALARGMSGEEAAAYGRRLSGAAMGLIGAVGALGGLGINLVFREAFLSSGSGTAAFVTFLGFYALCCAVTWAVYLRPWRPRRSRPSESKRNRSSRRCNRGEIRVNRVRHAGLAGSVHPFRPAPHASLGRSRWTTRTPTRTPARSRASPSASPLPGGRTNSSRCCGGAERRCCTLPRCGSCPSPTTANCSPPPRNSSAAHRTWSWPPPPSASADGSRRPTGGASARNCWSG